MLPSPLPVPIPPPSLPVLPPEPGLVPEPPPPLALHLRRVLPDRPADPAGRRLGSVHRQQPPGPGPLHLAAAGQVAGQTGAGSGQGCPGSGHCAAGAEEECGGEGAGGAGL